MTAVQDVEVGVPRVLGEVLQVGGLVDIAAAAHARVRADVRSGDLDQPQRQPNVADHSAATGIACSENGEPSTLATICAVLTPWPSLELRADDKYGARGLAEHLFGDASEQRSTQPAATVAGDAHEGAVHLGLLENRVGDVASTVIAAPSDLDDDIDHEITAQRGDRARRDRVGQSSRSIFRVGDTEQGQWDSRPASQCGGGMGGRPAEMRTVGWDDDPRKWFVALHGLIVRSDRPPPVRVQGHDSEGLREPATGRSRATVRMTRDESPWSNGAMALVAGPVAGT